MEIKIATKQLWKVFMIVRKGHLISDSNNLRSDHLPHWKPKTAPSKVTQPPTLGTTEVV